jgi:phosphatidylethanolamine/phosphatidyl-N-methylethanolamine N-methyltransferase
MTDWHRLRYDLWSGGYDWFVGIDAVSAARRRSLELLALQPGEELLIDGCGTGLDLPFVPAGVRVTAFDLSPRMVERARVRAAELGLKARIEVGDAMRLPYPDASFDAVLLHLILAIVADPRAALNETARVLRPGGRVAVFDKFVPGDECRPGLLRRALNIPSRLLFTDLTRCLEPLVADSPFIVEHQEPSLFGGQFRIARLRLAGAQSDGPVDPAAAPADTLGGGAPGPAADA